MRFAGAVFIAFLAAALVPAAAVAATVSSSGGEIRFGAGAGERNHVTVSNSSGEVVISDLGAPITAGAGCSRDAQPGADPTVRCPVAGVTRILFDLADGNDRLIDFLGGPEPRPAPLSLLGGTGTDDIFTSGNVSLDGVANDGPDGRDYVGGDVENIAVQNSGTSETLAGNEAANRLESPGGTDTFDGGDGPDYINARDVRFDLEENGSQAPDQVRCGPGNDLVDADDRDVVADDCETVIRKDGVARLTDSADVFRAQRPGLTIFGLGGNDVIAAGGAKEVSGGDGDDRITLGSAVDITANGNDGNDRIYGLVGRDRIRGGAGNDKLYGERSDDRIDGGPGRDGINAGRGNDTVRVRDGQIDRVKCSTGRDVVVADRRDKVARDCERVFRR